MENQFIRLIKILKKLRSNDGCPWDKKQTFQSLKPFIIEEVHEISEAVDEEDFQNLKEELGDVIMLCALYSNIAEEKGLFTIEEVLKNVADKLVFRHPHVFEEMKAENTGEANRNWELRKTKEKKRDSLLSGVPKGMSALLQASRVQQKAAHVGFDWEDIEDVFSKIREEVGELETAWQRKNDYEIEDEIGDLIFALVNLARFLEKNPEDIVKKTINKFKRRFNYIEKKAAKNSRKLEEMSLKEMDNWWDEAKLLERKDNQKKE